MSVTIIITCGIGSKNKNENGIVTSITMNEAIRMMKNKIISWTKSATSKRIMKKKLKYYDVII